MADPIEAALADLAVKKLVTKGYGVISSVMDLQSELQDTRTLIEAALLDGDSMSDQCSRTQQDTLEKLSCLLDRLLDLSDVRASRELQKQVMSGGNFKKEFRCFFSASNQAVARFKDARKVDDIKKKLSAIARNHAMISSICSKPTQARSIQSAESSSSNILTNLVIGRDKDRDEIVSMLSEDSLASGTTLSVSSIVWIGGMGKTTLACSGFRQLRILMIAACGEGELPHNQSNVAQLYHHFRRAIGGKKFLLVLDNIWDHNNDLRDKWLNLRKLLEFGANGSKVLITTRDQKVAGVLDSTASCMLGDLTEDDSCLLFQEIAFTQWQEAGVEAIGLEIAKMCPKVPLVIRSIGGLLAGKRTVQEWLAFRDEFQLANFASFGSDVMLKLPNSITRLVNLQSLYLDDCDHLEKLPRDMSKLVNLRHLKLVGSKKLRRHMPMGLGKLTDLRTLDTFIVGN
ncbi:disease resistance protein RGA2-like [Chenopodium quinoa]|uniref:disease resistance protein RGA2-like n=1 Tax=Chenopodium quinoa TaxID=63459 RepID=UPI000B79001A|nr:disease resistance protein RGA2-like [Chenopodium quinoa]